MGIAADRFQREIYRRPRCAHNLSDVLSPRIRVSIGAFSELGFYSAFLWYDFEFWVSVGRFPCFCKLCGFDFDVFTMRVWYVLYGFNVYVSIGWFLIFRICRIAIFLGFVFADCVSESMFIICPMSIENKFLRR